MSSLIRIAGPVILCLTLLPVAVEAQATDESSGSFVGVVTADDVNVRAGAGQNYYAVMQLEQGSLVEVHDNLYGWYRIVPPEGSFSYVSKAYVEMSPDGSTGRVTGDHVRVRAPAPGGPDRSYKIQWKLNEGDEVKIVGSEGAYHKIVPPTGAYLFIDSAFVAHATEADIARAQKMAAIHEQREGDVQWEGAPEAETDTATESTQAATAQASPAQQSAPSATTATESPAESIAPTQPAAGQPTVAEQMTEAATLQAVEQSAPAAAPAPAVTAEQTTPADDAHAMAAVEAPTEVAAPAPEPLEQELADLEERFEEAGSLPPDDQPLDGLIAMYEKILGDPALSSNQQALVETRLEILEARKQLRAAQAELAEAELEVERSAEVSPTPAAVVQTANDLPSAGTVATPTQRPVRYTAVGRLLASTLYTGDKLPLLFRLVDPLTGLTVAYIEPQEGVDYTRMLGDLVGVVGETRYDPAMKLKFISIKRMDALQAVAAQ
jgi:uncharacterized protein YgiM (DUF1202 family)